MEIILFLVCLIACVIGAISGIGGGIIIKPIVDSLGIIDIKSLSFLSGCTVLSMSVVSLFRAKKQNININFNVPIFLGLGAIIGGILGKNSFDILTKSFNNNIVGFIQSISLFFINIFILWYMYVKNKLQSKKIKSKIITILLGCLLGIVSSFLGIGGGPLNIAVIYYFYSFEPKQTTLASLIVVFFSQLSSLFSSIYVGLPQFSYLNLFVMCLGGIIGAMIGGNLAKKMDNNKTQKFFKKVLIILIFINIYNTIKFL